MVPLTNDANTVGSDLYMKNMETGLLTDISVDTNPADAESGANVLGMVGSSEDGSYVYYVATGAMAGAAESGKPNLYLWHDGSLNFIATLSPADEKNWQVGVIQEATSMVSPDGQHVLLSSAAPLTGYDNTDAVTGEPDTEIYSYSASSGQIACVSCRPDGSQPQTSIGLNPGLHGQFNAFEYPIRYMSDDGSLVVFATTESLLPKDVNGVQDVYAYRDGQLHLLSTGNSEFPTLFISMSPNGEDVFLGTSEKLTATDKDLLSDVYDARSGGGFPPPAEAEAACTGVECPRQESARPGAAAVGSATFQGAPNQSSKRACPAGKRKVRKKGRTQCVAKQSGATGKKKAHKKSNGKGKRHASSVEGGK
jgi:hypothetical protein